MKAIKTFLSQNPTFNLASDNLARISVQEKLNWKKLDKTKLLPQLQTYQRLHRICSDENVVTQLMDTGFHSAHQIAMTPETEFTLKMNAALGEDQNWSNSIWRKSQKITQQVNQLVMAIKPESNGTVIARRGTTTMKKTDDVPMAKVAVDGATDFETDMPSYNQLFGPQYFCECDECRSIWGPAAYYVDLMHLIHQYITVPTDLPKMQSNLDGYNDGTITSFSDPDRQTIFRESSLLARRPDLWTMELSCANTYDEEPYLKIANQVMEAKLKLDLGVDDLGAYVAGYNDNPNHDAATDNDSSVYPFNLPFNLPEEEIKGYLNHFGIALSDVFDYLEVDEVNVARAALDISTNQLNLLKTSHSGNLKLVYGLYASECGTGAETVAYITTVEGFLDKTGLAVKDLSALFYQNCPEPALTKSSVQIAVDVTENQAKLYHQFFINQKENANHFINYLDVHLNGLDSTTAIEVASDTTTGVVPKDVSLDRLQRFIRLAQKMQWTFADLDWALIALGVADINEDAIKGLAKIQAIMDQFSIPVDQATALFADMKTYGQGKGIISETLFDRTFNQPDYFNGGSAPYQPNYDGNPLFSTDPSLTLTWDFSADLSTSSDANSTIRSSLLATLNLTDMDLTILTDYLKNNVWSAGTTTLSLTVPNLSLLYRYSQLPKLLKLSMDQFCRLLPKLPSDSLASVDELTELIRYVQQAQQSVLTIGQINFLLTPEEDVPISIQQKMAREQQIMLDQLQQSAATVLLNEKSFVSPDISEKESFDIFGRLVLRRFINREGVVLEERPMLREEFLTEVIAANQSAIQAKAGQLESELPTSVSLPGDIAPIGDAVLEIVLRNKEQQQKLVTSALAGFYQLSIAAVEVGMILTKQQLADYIRYEGVSLESIEELVVAKVKGKSYNPRLLLIPLSDENPKKAALKEYLQKLPRNLSWLTWNQLSPLEGFLISKNPVPFGIDNMGYGYQPTFSDLMAISTYKQQCTTFGTQGLEYLEYLNQYPDANNMGTYTPPATGDLSALENLENQIAAKIGEDVSPTNKRKTLANLANWDSDQLDFLITSFNGLTDVPDFNKVQGVQSLINCFQVSQTMGVDTSVIWHLSAISNELVSSSSTWESYVNVATEFRNAFILHYQGDDLATAMAPMEGQMEERKRDFLCNLLIWKLGEFFDDIKTQDQLYEFLLLDVEMTSVVNISPLKLGLNSLQLYVQRCLMNLETEVVCTIPKTWWSWMGDYREWQANREVYLYPENYVDPTLRKLQSPLFSDLVKDVKQSSITRDSVKTAYTNYLNGLKEVANLHIVDSVVHRVPSDLPGVNNSENKKIISVFGRTLVDPVTYYYREGLVPAGTDAPTISDESISWTPWTDLNLNIPSDYLTPVFAFNKLFVFWVTQQQSASNVTSNDGTRTSYPYVTATINYAYQQVGEGWSVPQVLQSDILICVMDENSVTVAYKAGENYYDYPDWQKVKAWAIPKEGNQEAAILITIGDMVSSFSYTEETTSEEQATFSDRLAVVNTNCSENDPNYTTVISGFLVNAGLRVSEIDPLFDLTNTDFLDGRFSDDSPNILFHSPVPDFYQGQEPGAIIHLDTQYDLVDAELNVTATNNHVTTTTTNINGYNYEVLEFNGSSAYYKIDDSGVAILPESFYFSCWFKISSIPDADSNVYWAAIFDCRDTNDKQGFTLYCSASSSTPTAGDDITLVLWMWNDNGEEDYNISSKVSKDTWYGLNLIVAPSEALVFLEELETERILENYKKYEFTEDYTPSTHGVFQLGTGSNGGGTAKYFFEGYLSGPEFYRFGLGSIPSLSWSWLSSVANQRSWYTLNTGKESFLALPKMDVPSTDTVLTATYTDSGMLELAYSAALGDIAFDADYQYVRLSTNVVEQMLEEVFSGGLPTLLSPASQYLQELDFSQYEPNPGISPPSAYMNFSGAYGLYFWELFYHIPMYLARSLQLDQQFSEAMQWYDVIFDPMLSQQDLTKIADIPGRPSISSDNPMLEYLLFAPFQASDFQSTYDVLLNEPEQVLLYEYDPFDPNAIAALRPSAYAKSTVMQYIGNLIAYGDYLFTEDSWESINSATMYYTTAQRLLGNTPPEKSDETDRMDKTYLEMQTERGIYKAAQFMVDMEVEVPAGLTGNSQVDGFLAQLKSVIGEHFCIPSNTQLETYRETIEDRLNKIRNGLNINGQTNDIPLFQPPIDPGAAVQAAASGSGTVSNLSSSLNVPYYRFSYLIGVAKSFTAQVIQFGGQLLAALEKQDAEHLSNLHESQSNTILNMMTEMKEDQINQLYAQQSNLQATLESAQIQQQTYQQWINIGMNEGELNQLKLTRRSIILNQLCSDTSLLSSPMYLIPTVYGLADGSFSPGDVTAAVAKSFLALAELEGELSKTAGMKGAFDRSNDSWNLQLQLAQNSIAAANAQLQGIQYQIDSAEQDYNINQTRISQSNDVINFLQTKFTNEDLYQWMAGQVSTIYFQAYQVALNLAMMAQSAYQYEFSTSQTYISNAGWNDLYKGLMAGETLSQSLQQLEQAYILGNSRSLEIEKTISLLQLQPDQLDALKTSGSCTFGLSEQLFDLDFPGHYKRKITSIAITIPAIVGPYQNVHATLTQTSNMVLADANIDAVQYAMGTQPGGVGGQVPSGVCLNWNSNQAIAVSKGTNDSGLFQLNFNDERYLPFEGTGAISTWRLDMPAASNQFNFDSISDVIINLRYTAYDGGDDFRNQVLNITDINSKMVLREYSGTKYFSMRQYFGVAWQQFLNTGASSVEFARAMFIPNVEELSLTTANIVANAIMQDGSIQELTATPPADNTFDSGSLTVGISGTVTDPADLEDVMIQIPYSGTLAW